MLDSFGVINLGTFLLGVCMIIITPGPNSLWVLSTGIRFGRPAGVKAMAGIVTGDAVLMFLASAGAAAAIAAYPVSYTIIRYGGAAYLAFLGLRILFAEWRRRPGETVEAKRVEGYIYPKSLFVSLSNPSTIIFYMAFFVQFVAPERSGSATPFLVLALVVQFVSISYLSLLIAAGSRLAAFFRERYGVTRFFRYALGVLFVCFSLRLAWAGITN